MIFIGGISQGRKILDYVRTVICGCCGRYGRYEVIMTYTYFSFFFIPLFKWNRQFYVRFTAWKRKWARRFWRVRMWKSGRRI